MGLKARERVAVLGGDGRHTVDAGPEARVRIYRSPRDGGTGDVRRLLDSIRAGGVDRVVILVRFNSHSATDSVRRACKRAGVPVAIKS